MASRNAESYLRGLDAFNRDDKVAWMEVCDPELENVPPREWPEQRPTKGAAAVWDLLTEFTEPWEEARFEVVGPIAESGHKLVAQVEGQVQGKASGAQVLWTYHNVVTFRDGRPARFDWFADRAEALETAGISEPE